MSRLGHRSNKSHSPVASPALCVLVLAALAAGAGAVRGGVDDLAGPLREVALQTGARADTSAVVTVEVLFTTAEAARTTDLAPFGAQIQFLRGRRMQALVPARSLVPLAALPQVAQVAPPAQLIPCQGYGAVVSEGVQLTSASSLHVAGYTGRNCKIAILDLGFANLDDTEVPVNTQDPAALLSFRTDGRTDASEHGSAVAETVADMAPDASLTLIAVDTAAAVESAIDYVIARSYNVAVMGLVLVEGPFDGSHPVARAVDRAAAAGVLWVQAAGNMAQRHWAGTYTDTDGDNISEYAKNLEDLTLTLTAGRFDAYLSWFETAGPQTGQDYDLVLLDASGNLIAQSSFGQNGDDPPREHLIATVPTAGQYRLQIRRIAGDPAKPDAFQLFVPSYDLPTALQVPTSSLATPAEAPGAFTVGATRGTTVDATAYGTTNVLVDVIEPFSSQGPTLQGDTKPDLVGPDLCRTSMAAPGNPPLFADYEYIAPYGLGTSFAAAHVAGAAAVLWSEDNTRTRSDLARALIALRREVPPPLPPVPPLPNNTYGHGRVNLRTGTDVARPILRITFPRDGDTISTMQPLITASLVDEGGSGIDETSIVLKIDGQAVTGTVFDPTSGLLSYRVAPPGHAPLSRGSHRITLDAKDRSGNAGQQAAISFRVAPPSIEPGLHMFSIPYAALTDLSPSSLFGLPPDQVVVVRWVPTDTTPENKYHFWGGPRGQDPYASFEPLDARDTPPVVTDPPAGLGYFVYLASNATLNPTGVSLSDRVSYQIRLSHGFTAPRGWNMIGCPFPDPVTWGAVQFITNGKRQDLAEAVDDGVTEGILFQLKRQGNTVVYDFPSDPLAGTLQPWKGYWIHVLKDTTLVLYNSLITTTGAPTPTPSQPKPTANRWCLRVGASAAGGADPTQYIAIAPGASDGYDPGKDVPEPPALDSPVRVYLSGAAWGDQNGQYAKDVRGALGAGQEWDLVVECTQADADVTVNWPELNNSVPADVSLVLRDVASGREVYMRTAAGYTFHSSQANTARHLKIIAVPARERALQFTSVTTSEAADGSVNVTYAVTEAADVTIQVLNIAGRCVRRFGGRAVEPGRTQTLTWNRRNEQGARVPPGKYMVQITARAANGQATQAIRTFQLGR